MPLDDKRQKTAVELTEEFIEETGTRLTQLERSLFRRWLLVTLALVIVGVFVVKVNSRVSSGQRSNTQALCAFRGDLQRRVDESNAFLKGFDQRGEPLPKSIAGIPIGSIKVSLANERASLASLKSLHC